jgi:hypothetical protein
MLEANHPKQTLLFYFSEDFSEDDVDQLRASVERLGQARRWPGDAPWLVDETDYDVEDAAQDQPVRTVGVAYQIYSAMPPWGSKLPPDVDRRQYEEVTTILDEMKQLSARIGRQIGLELDGDDIGRIDKGEEDRSIRIGLMDEWRKAVGA